MRLTVETSEFVTKVERKFGVGRGAFAGGESELIVIIDTRRGGSGEVPTTVTGDRDDRQWERRKRQWQE